ncbi:hypothetical protein B0H17DRAFT_1147439 [Mycena rosella]|uniref:Uncharacterized protein n=1 Tax=Mycena rosella TaxID=1033263 RepID=A0AAD7G060_MYCRO|nr:hypothetical protein B0H17DRAFT_1147439 [Mycena rosella]
MTGWTQGGDADVASVCTDNIATAYASCYNCEASSGEISQAEAQQAIATFAQACEAGGHPVDGNVDGVTASPAGGTGGGGERSSSTTAGSGSIPALPEGAGFIKTGVAVRTTAGLMGGASAVMLLGFENL